MNSKEREAYNIGRYNLPGNYEGQVRDTVSESQWWQRGRREREEELKRNAESAQKPEGKAKLDDGDEIVTEFSDETKGVIRRLIEQKDDEDLEEGGFGKIADTHFPEEAAAIRKDIEQEQVDSELAGLWNDKFDAKLRKDLVEQIEDDGAAWEMDRKGNFLLGMKGGKKLFVGYKKVAGEKEERLICEKRGGGFSFSKLDALHIMQGNRSLGHSQLSTFVGTRKHKAMMWAAAKVVGVKFAGTNRTNALSSC
jgi:hypothetical protein